ncbi:LamG-like jellyroll fold domain-containing protein [Actinocrispum sp. NPDC049592]|uniref:LamG-like jellyroll fold domain-containing protein n=1 Tax=Actinocrispum sp. NPDC049592 TaxID=3154835 RepID=UPI003448A3C8
MSSTRRFFLASAGALGAGAAIGSVSPASAETGSWCPDQESPRFTVAVIPDTQYLYDRDRGDSAPLEASLRYIVDTAAEHNTVFVAHLGDLTENGQPGEFDQIGRTFRYFDTRRVAYSVLAGNHDIDSSKDDQRGPSAYLNAFGPQRFRTSPSLRGATKDGYNTYHTFRAAGREWLVLALDWRPSAGTIEWARGVLRKYPKSPVILTTHEFVHADSGDGKAQLSDFGQRLWDQLVKGSDQIFLTLNGHFWPPGRTVLRNDAGHDVHAHITNYQDRYYGGSAMIRLYRFDLERNTIDVETLSPWLLRQSAERLNLLSRQEIERTGPDDSFSVPIGFTARFSGFDPRPEPAARPVRDLLIPGTQAYWRFDARNGRDLSGNGNDLVVTGNPQWTPDHHREQPAHGSVFLKGEYFRTVSGAPLNMARFERGYTIEAFFKIPRDFSGANAWGGLLSRIGTGADAGKTGDDPKEPVATLSISDGHGVQWAVFPLNQNGISTNWGHELPLDKWWHVAVVNDGRTTTVYIEGSRLLRNPSTPAVGICTANDSWLVGAYTYDRKIDRTFYGWVGDIRVVNRALPVSQFMLYR